MNFFLNLAKLKKFSFIVFLIISSLLSACGGNESNNETSTLAVASQGPIKVTSQTPVITPKSSNPEIIYPSNSYYYNTYLNLDWSSEKNELAVGDKQGIKLLNTDGKLITNLKGLTENDSLKWSPDGKMLAGLGEREILVWDSSGSIISTIPKIGNDISWSPQSDMIAVLNLKEGGSIWTFDGKPVLSKFSIFGDKVSWSTDGKRISGSEFDTSFFVNSATGEIFSDVEYPHHQGISSKCNKSMCANVLDVTWSNAGDTLFLSYKDGTTQFVKFSDKTFEVSQKIKDSSSSSCIAAWSPSKDKLATTSSDNTVKLWDLDGNLLQTFTGHLGPICSLAWSPDGSKIISGSKDKTLKLWTIEGTLLATLTGIDSEITNVNWSPDGKTITAVYKNGIAQFWISAIPVATTTTSSAYLTSTPTKVVPTPTITSAKTALVKGTDQINIRETPSLSGKILTTIKNGEKVTIKDGPKDVEGRSWYQIEYGGVVGWASSTFLEIQ